MDRAADGERQEPDPLLDDLRGYYLRQLPKTIASLEAALRLYRSAPDEGATVLRGLSHSLGGSGGAYGFPEVTALARQTEQAPPDTLPPSVFANASTTKCYTFDNPSTCR